MITKGIIKGIPNVNSNKYRVYIPLLRNANDEEIDATLDATLCFLNGVYYSLAVDDVVYVDFEDNYYEKPVILGKLYTNTEDKNNVPTQLTVKTINVLDKAQFPSNTELDGKSTSNFYRNIKDIQEDIWSLRKQIDELVWINLDDPDQNAFMQAVNNLNDNLNAAEALIDELTSNLSETTTTANNAINEANKAKEDLANAKQNLEETKEQLSQTQEKLTQTTNELDSTKEELSNTKTELENTKVSLEDTKKDLDETETNVGNLQGVTESINLTLDKHAGSLSSLGSRLDLTDSNLTLKLDISKFEDFKDVDFEPVRLNAVKVPALNDRVVAAESTLTAKLDTSLFDKFKTDEFTPTLSIVNKVPVLSDKVSAAELNLNGLSTSISNLNSSIGKKLDASTFDSFKLNDFAAISNNANLLSTRLTSAETNLSGLTTSLSGLTVSIGSLNTSIANKLDVSTFSTFKSGEYTTLTTSVSEVQEEVKKMKYYNHSISMILQDNARMNKCSIRCN